MSEIEPDPEDAANCEEACRREDAVRKFVLRRDGNRKSATVKELAQELGLSRATAYRMIAIFQAGGTVTSLMGKAAGRRRGHCALDPKREGPDSGNDQTLLSQADKAISRTPRS